jgi:hypothetical protein
MVRGTGGLGKFGLKTPQVSNRSGAGGPPLPQAAKVALGGCNRYTRLAYSH